MHTSPEDMRAGYQWFFIAGSLAVALSIGLFLIDRSMQLSKGEQVLKDQLLQLRGAQHALPRGSNDPRVVDDFHSLKTSDSPATAK